METIFQAPRKAATAMTMFPWFSTKLTSFGVVLRTVSSDFGEGVPWEFLSSSQKLQCQHFVIALETKGVKTRWQVSRADIQTGLRNSSHSLRFLTCQQPALSSQGINRFATTLIAAIDQSRVVVEYADVRTCLAHVSDFTLSKSRRYL